MATYKTKNGEKMNGFVPSVGLIVDGILENAPDDFENPNFVKVTQPNAPAPQNPTPATPVTPVAPPSVAQPTQTTNTETN